LTPTLAEYLRDLVETALDDVAFNRVDALYKRIDADLFAAVGHLLVAPERPDPVFVGGSMSSGRPESWANHESKR